MIVLDRLSIRTGFFVALGAFACGAAVGCGSSEAAVPPRPAMTAPAPTTAAPVVAAPPTDPQGVPNHGPATACPAATGDTRAMRTRLRALERGRDLVPPEAASLLEGCGATARDIAKSLEKAGKAIARARAHDYVAAAAYFRRALEVDPSYVSARVALAGARARTNDFDGAMYQLEQVRSSGSAGARAMARIYADGALATLRLQPRFWTWAGNPVPEMVGTLPGATEVALSSVGPSLSFTPGLTIPPDVIYARLSLSGANYRTLGAAVTAAIGHRVELPGSLSRDLLVSPWIEGLSSIGASLLTRPSAYRFGDGNVVLALPFVAGPEGAKVPLVVIAMGPEAGPYDVVKVVAGGDSCDEPVMFSSSDRRVLGFFTSCDGGTDPTSFGRCIIVGDAGRVVMRCGNGASSDGVVGATASDGEEDYGGDEYDEEDWQEEEYGEEDYGD